MLQDAWTSFLHKCVTFALNYSHIYTVFLNIRFELTAI